MYVLLFLLVAACGAALIVAGTRKPCLWLRLAGAGLIGADIVFFWFLGFWAEALWFENLGFGGRFWRVVYTKVVSGLAGGVLGALIVYGLTAAIPRERRFVRVWPEAVGGLLGALAGVGNWDRVLLFLNAADAGKTDPILSTDVSFYLFRLPLYDVAANSLLALTVISLCAAALGVFATVAYDSSHGGRLSGSMHSPSPRGWLALRIPVAAFLVVWGGWWFLRQYHLLYSESGIVTGPGWVDVHVRLPAYRVLAGLCVLGGIAYALLPVRRLLRPSDSAGRLPRARSVVLTALPLGLVCAAWLVGTQALPPLFQYLYVNPNEITLEAPYIAHNIAFTRDAFGISHIEDKQLDLSQTISQELVDRNQDLLQNIRLWDWRALGDVYRQFQEIRLYYRFDDVDVDRYRLDGEYRQVMVSPREMDLRSLAQESQTFVNRRFKYTHGYGIAMSPVHEFTPDGLPVMFIQGIPPKTTEKKLAITRPQIYYGTLTQSHVIVNSRQQEFDYPTGDENAYNRYSGTGGVQMSSFWRKFLFGAKFDGTPLLLSGYPTRESRIMFHRDVRSRVRRVAPFLRLEQDPYIVVNEGRLVWMIDCYTVSSYYPYSRTSFRGSGAVPAPSLAIPNQAPDSVTHLAGINYVRNSVKAVVDAFDGSVSLYVFDEQDPVLRAWAGAFPGLFKPRDEMPAGLQAHVRYPASLLLTQGMIYAKYHMTDPSVFYNQEDLWVRATEKYYSRVQPVEPYFVMWQLPGSASLEFSVILPFTPKNKQVLIGWLAGLCDGKNYGRLLAYKLPKERRVLGPQQVETKIDQDSVLSGQLSLWDQRGSRVIRGNLLTIPIENSLLYVEPIYLQAETAAYPELRLVTVMLGDRFSYAETFSEALKALIEPDRPRGRLPETAAVNQSVQALVSQADNAFRSYTESIGQGRFQKAADALSTLQQAIEQLRNATQTDRKPDNVPANEKQTPKPTKESTQ